jgi:tetratricopeptide (TPR) repeat protein
MANVYLLRFHDFVMNDLELCDEFDKIELEFPQLDIIESDRYLMLLDWFLFDYRLKKNNSKVLDAFINAMRPEMTVEELQVYKSFQKNILSLFEVRSLRIGKDLILRDLATEKEYWVMDTTVSRSLRKGQCAFIRVLPFQDHNILFGSVHAFSKKSNLDLKLTARTLRESKQDFRVTSKDLAEYLFRIQTKTRLDDDYVAIAKQIEKKLDAVGLSDVNIYRVMEDISQGRIHDVGELYRQFHKKAKFANRDDEIAFSQALVSLWNKMPHKYMGGISPEEKKALLKRGPLEESLIQQMLTYIQIKINPEKYFSDESRQKAVRRTQKKWLDTPMTELNGKSPREMILEERKKLGCSDHRIGHTVDIHPVFDSDQDEEAHKLFEAGLRLSKQGKYRKAVEAYKSHLEIIPNNHVAWGNLGSVYCMLVDKKEAERCLSQALSINPDYQIAKNNLSMLRRTSVKEMEAIAQKHKIQFTKS